MPFFIEGASQIEPILFWQYFMFYDAATMNLEAFATVYEAHQTAVKFRAKLS